MVFQLDLNDPRQAHIAERLRTEIMLWLASVRPDGRPHLVPVWYLWEGGDTILIFSKPKNQKVYNIRENPAVNVSLETADQGDDVVVFEGTATLVDDPELAATMPTYAAKYAQRLADMGWTAEVMAASFSQAIRVTITRVTVSY